MPRHLRMVNYINITMVSILIMLHIGRSDVVYDITWSCTHITLDSILKELFLLYYPLIVELRRLATNSFWGHCQAISGLSKLLLVSFKVILVASLIISLSNVVGYWELTDMVVLLTTFLQSFAVMYYVHCGWHRYDLSIDAVIKYFGKKSLSILGWNCCPLHYLDLMLSFSFHSNHRLCYSGLSRFL